MLGNTIDGQVAGAAAEQDESQRPRRRPLFDLDRWYPVIVFVLVAVPLFGIVAWSAYQTFSEVTATPPWRPYKWLAGWTRWDAGWYEQIAVPGYSYHGPGQQSSVAFFPAYPLLLRIGGRLGMDRLLFGTIATFVLGLAAAKLFYSWCKDRMSVRAARTAVVVLLAYPFSWFLVGAVYSDALFLLTALGSFVLLDRDRPVLAGLVGAIATATRPVGLALILGLVVRAVERRGVISFSDGRPHFDRHRLRPADAGVLLSTLGVGSYCLYLRSRFGNPFAFVSVAGAPGWGHDANWHTWLKTDRARYFLNWVYDLPHVTQAVQGTLTIVALLLVPFVIRRFGWGYGSYAFAIVFVPALSTADFVGMGRYMLAAFPCFAVAGDLLSRRPLAIRLPLLAGSSVLLLSFASLFSRFYLIS